MIKTFKDRDTKTFFEEDGQGGRFPDDIIDRALSGLVNLDAAKDPLRDLGKTAGYRLKKLEGKRKDEWSMRINNRWRICFKWKDGNAYDVEINDHYK